jgi:hypothetical protein
MIFISAVEEDTKDWKLRLRYGKLTTTFKHFTVLADGVVGKLGDGFECRPGRAWMSMKTWATDADESMDMIRVIGERIGFTVDGRIEVYVTEPDQPPGEKPHGYDIRFTPYDENA